ncbi:MAG TPA: Ig-like domain-containing protein [Kofleriaceae bacterium]|nr:Ig-like domain-containing protein [Kofleriaceae bacterium]
MGAASRRLGWLTCLLLSLAAAACSGDGSGGMGGASDDDDGGDGSTVGDDGGDSADDGGDSGDSGDDGGDAGGDLSLSIDPPAATMADGDQLRMVAIAAFPGGNREPVLADWASQDPSIVDVRVTSDGAAHLEALEVGETTVTAGYQGLSATASIVVVQVIEGLRVMPGDVTLPPEFSVQIRAVDGASDVTDDVTWTVADGDLGQVGDTAGSKGLFTALAAGQTTVTASAGGQSASMTVDILPTRLIGRDGLPPPEPSSLLHQPIVAMGGTGAATAAWTYQVSGEVFTGGHDGTDWTDRVQVNAQQEPPDHAVGERIAASEAGARVLVWNGLDYLYSTYARPGAAFGVVRRVPTALPNFGQAYMGVVALTVTTSGDAMLVWHGGPSTFFNRFDAAANRWSPPTQLAQLVGATAFSPDGDGVTTWFTVDGQESTLHAALLVGGTQIQGDEALFTSTPVGIENVTVAINDARDVVVAWTADDSDFNDVPHVAQFSTELGWHTNRLLPAPPDITAHSLRADINESGQAMVAWADPQGFGVYANRYTPADGWLPVDVLSDSVGLATPQIFDLFLTTSGHAICFFEPSESFVAFPFKYRRFIAGQGWAPMETIDVTTWVGWPNQSLRVAYNRAGRGVLSWQEAADDFVNYNFMALGPTLP